VSGERAAGATESVVRLAVGADNPPATAGPWAPATTDGVGAAPALPLKQPRRTNSRRGRFHEHARTLGRSESAGANCSSWPDSASVRRSLLSLVRERLHRTDQRPGLRGKRASPHDRIRPRPRGRPATALATNRSSAWGVRSRRDDAPVQVRASNGSAGLGEERGAQRPLDRAGLPLLRVGPAPLLGVGSSRLAIVPWSAIVQKQAALGRIWLG